MTNYLNGNHSATGPGAGRQDAGAGNTWRQFALRVASPVSDSVVALETSPDNTTFTEQARVTGDGWAFARSDHKQRYARVNIISLGTGGNPLLTNITSYPGASY
jgi:hypothetical protein